MQYNGSRNLGGEVKGALIGRPVEDSHTTHNGIYKGFSPTGKK